MWKLKHQRTNKGFTIIELLVTIGIIAALAGTGAVTVSKVRTVNQQTTCVNNLRAISQGLQLYYNDYMSFPEDGYPDDGDDLYPLSTDLAGYINNKSTFICPEDKDTTSTVNFASYDPYYVARNGPYGTDELAIGCPRHRGGSNSTSTFSTGSTEITSVGTVLDISGQEIPPDGTTAQRTISKAGKTMTFDDGSTVTVGNSSSNYGCILVQSVQLADGTLYSIIKVQDDGIIDVVVTPGSKFEVVTPSAIVGVRGTEFTVETSTNGTAGYRTLVTHSDGIVVVTDRETGKVTILKNVGTTTTTGDTAQHFHWHTHANGERHRHDHPPQNQAHHGKSGANEDDEDESKAGTIICHKPASAQKTIEISLDDPEGLSRHLRHGDSVGACQ